MVESRGTRRAFLTKILAGSAVAVVGVGAVGCAGPIGAQGGEGPVEVVPMHEGLWYANTLPTSIPAVRFSPASAPKWSTPNKSLQ
jgi:hypothetical protein